MTARALIFDVDGTLADTEESHLAAFNLAFDSLALGFRWSREQYRGLLKVTGGKERLLAFIDSLALEEPERARLRRLVPAIHAEKTRLYTAAVKAGAVALRPGVARLFEEARSSGKLLGIASTTSVENVEALLAATLGDGAAGLFAAVATGDEARLKKPAPDVYLLALRRLSVAPAEAIAFEDSAHGLAAARAAQIWTAVTPCYWTDGDDFAGAGVVLDSLARVSLGELESLHASSLA